MSNLNKDLLLLLLQYLDEQKYNQTRHSLEKESGVFFNTNYLEELVRNGEWEELENYLSGFTELEDNRYSMQIFFEIRKQKYLEALDKGEEAKAVEILRKELQVFSAFNKDLYRDTALLLSLKNFRENEELSSYGDTKSGRETTLVNIKTLMESNPKFNDKLQFPAFMKQRLRFLIDQGLSWQHLLCKHQKPNPDIKSLFVDHKCDPSINPVPQVGGPSSSSIIRLSPWLGKPSSLAQLSISYVPTTLIPPPSFASTVNHPRGPQNVLKRPITFELREENNQQGNSPSINAFPVTSSLSLHSADDLPMTVVSNLNQGSTVTSMDFHPEYPTTLLVGTNTGDISVWNVGTGTKLVFRNLKFWDLGSHSLEFQASMANENTASVNRVLWSPDGALVGVAYSKHIVQLHAYDGMFLLRNHLEIESHAGSVNDLAFCYPKDQLCFITCGEDKTIKVWDAATGAKQYTFDGHVASVYSVCSLRKNNHLTILSNSVDGKIKVWLYGDRGSQVHYDAPCDGPTTFAYTAGGQRLFSCGTSKDGESCMVEWNASQGTVKRRYAGFAKRSVGVVHFDMVKSRFLAAGDEFAIKYWDMNKENLLNITYANGGLPASPVICFDKPGYQLAVSTSENGFKVLANAHGIQLFHPIKNHSMAHAKLGADTSAGRRCASD